MELAALRNEVATVWSETDRIDFKSKFDPSVLRDWVETTKDIVAMYNSGGGVIVFGVNDDGTDGEVGTVLGGDVDPAQVVDKVRKYTGHVIQGLVLDRIEKDGKTYFAWFVPAASVPLPFKEPGTWEKPDRRQETVFSRGQVYFRHGAKSEFTSHEDMVAWAQRIGDAARVKFAQEMQNVARLPDGFTVQAVPPGIVMSVPKAIGQVRITTDPHAPVAVVVDPFKTHPYRQTEVIKQLATRIQGCRVNSHDLKCIRKLHAAEIEAKSFMYFPPHSSPHYSEEFVQWVIGRAEDDSAFLEKVRAECKTLIAVSVGM